MSHLWRLTTHIDFAILGSVVQRLDTLQPSMIESWSLFDEGDIARLDVLFASTPDEAAFRAAADLPDGQAFQVATMEEADRGQLTESGLKPLNVGRFTLSPGPGHTVPTGQIEIQIDASQTFGTGRHGSTLGCLVAFQEILPAMRPPACVLDMGCGSAVLAIAAAKTLPDAHITAVDVDPRAVEGGRANCASNGVTDIDCFVSEGFDHTALRGQQFELIFANIYARLLIDLATDIAAALTSGGQVILGGLIIEEEEKTRGIFERAGLSVVSRAPIERWVTLIATKP